MNHDGYPFDNEALMLKVNGLKRLASSYQFSVGDHDLRLDIYESVRTGGYDYELFEWSTVEIVSGQRAGDKSGTWLREYHFPHDPADSAEGSLAAALRWISDYYPKRSG